MTKKDMITEYCFMYVDFYGFFPNRKQLEEFSEDKVKALYFNMKILHKKLDIA